MAAGANSAIPAAGAKGWGGDPPLWEAARERLLDAAARCLDRVDLSDLGMGQVASEAGVSRQTVYRYFEDRDALISALLARSAMRLADAVRMQLAAHSTASEMAVECVMFGVERVSSDAVLRKIWEAAALDARSLRGFTEPTALAFSRHAGESLIAAAGWKGDEIDEALEVMIRFILSLLVSPSPREDADSRREFLRRRMLPALSLTP